MDSHDLFVLREILLNSNITIPSSWNKFDLAREAEKLPAKQGPAPASKPVTPVSAPAEVRKAPSPQRGSKRKQPRLTHDQRGEIAKQKRIRETRDRNKTIQRQKQQLQII